MSVQRDQLEFLTKIFGEETALEIMAKSGRSRTGYAGVKQKAQTLRGVVERMETDKVLLAFKDLCNAVMLADDMKATEKAKVLADAALELSKMLKVSGEKGLLGRPSHPAAGYLEDLMPSAHYQTLRDIVP